MKLPNKLMAEFLGTCFLVLGGCGSAVLAGATIGTLGISIAFGLTVLTMAYAVGHISGGHFNPAVTIGLWIGGRFPGKEVSAYVIAQLVGAIAGAGILYAIVSGVGGVQGLDLGGFAANGYDHGIEKHSPGGYGLRAAFVTEMVLTFFFLIVILGATHSNAAKGFGGLAIGLSLVLIHLISIPITNTSVNPARSTSQALFVGGWAWDQLWLFWVAPIVGAVIAGFFYKWMAPEKGDSAKK